MPEWIFLFFVCLFVFSCSTLNGTGLGEEVSRVGGQDRIGSPGINQEILRPTCHIQLHPWLQPHDGYLWQVGWLEWATSVLLNHHEGRLGAWSWGSCVLRAECHTVSQLMAFIESCFRRGHSLDTLWPSVSPVYTLDICLVLQGLRVCHRASLEGGQHLDMSCLFPSLLFLSLGLPLLFSVIKGIGGCLDHLI